jgi:hypothetical protein
MRDEVLREGVRFYTPSMMHWPVRITGAGFEGLHDGSQRRTRNIPHDERHLRERIESLIPLNRT